MELHIAEELSNPFSLNIFVYFNGELESRRGKKLRIGDKIDIPDMNIDILLTQPTSEEQDEYQADKVEKERIAKLVRR